MQHSDDRLTMDLLNTSKTIWSIITSPTPFLTFRNLFKLLMHDTGNEVSRETHTSESSGNKSESKSDTSKSDNKSGKNSMSKQKNSSGSIQGNTSETKGPTSNLVSKLGKDGKLMPQECQCQLDNNLCLFCGISGQVAQDFSKAAVAKAHTAKAEQDKSALTSSSEPKKD